MQVIVIGIVIGLIGIGAFFYATQKSQNDSASSSETSQSGDAEANSSIVGRWQSEGDVSFMREFKSNGTVVDTYGGPEHAEVSGTWTTFSKEEPIASVSFPLDEKATYIKAMFDGEAYYYKITSVSNARLELVYMDRGGVLTFTRLP